MSDVQIEPSAARVAEHVSFQGVVLGAANLAAALSNAIEWATILSGHTDAAIAAAANERIRIYHATSKDIDALLAKLEAKLHRSYVDAGQNRPDGITTPIAAVAAHVDSMVEAAKQRGLEGGIGVVVLYCRACETGRWVGIAGVCSNCKSLAVDSNAPADDGFTIFTCDDCDNHFHARRCLETETNQDVACPKCHSIETSEGRLKPMRERLNQDVGITIAERQR